MRRVKVEKDVKVRTIGFRTIFRAEIKANFFIMIIRTFGANTFEKISNIRPEKITEAGDTLISGDTRTDKFMIVILRARTGALVSAKNLRRKRFINVKPLLADKLVIVFIAGTKRANRTNDRRKVIIAVKIVIVHVGSVKHAFRYIFITISKSDKSTILGFVLLQFAQLRIFSRFSGKTQRTRTAFYQNTLPSGGIDIPRRLTERK